MNSCIERYVDEAIRFRPEPGTSGSARRLRVAPTLVTCRLAAAVLNALAVPEEVGATYVLVNVHNPACPLSFDGVQRRWGHAPELADHPVWGINWAGAVLVCRHLDARLPSEGEWEAFASNNDPTRSYPWGEAPPNARLANFGEHFGGTSEVRSFPPTELGLFDVAGNLCEWCRDPRPCGGARTAVERIVKGGAWSKDAHQLLIGARRSKWERLGTTTIGFRPVWDD